MDLLQPELVEQPSRVIDDVRQARRSNGGGPSATMPQHGWDDHVVVVGQQGVRHGSTCAHYPRSHATARAAPTPDAALGDHIAASLLLLKASGDHRTRGTELVLSGRGAQRCSRACFWAKAKVTERSRPLLVGTRTRSEVQRGEPFRFALHERVCADPQSASSEAPDAPPGLDEK